MLPKHVDSTGTPKGPQLTIPMIANDLTLNPGSYGGTAANLVFSLGGFPSPTSSVRRVIATAMTEPNLLTISHRDAQKGSLKYAQRMIRRDRALIDPLMGTVSGSVWFGSNLPLGTSVFTSAVVKDMFGHLMSCYMTAGLSDQFLAGDI